MAAVHAAIPLSLDAAAAALRQSAASHGHSFDEAHSDHDELVFNKGMTLVSWGSQLAIQLESIDDSTTRASVSTGETFAITDWGRGKRAAEKLLTDAGATIS